MDAKAYLKELVEKAVKGLCQFPENVVIHANESGGKTLCLVIECKSDDLALIIGRHGGNIKALRHLIWAIATNHKINANLIVNE